MSGTCTPCFTPTFTGALCLLYVLSKGVAAAFEKMVAPLFTQMKNIQKQSRTLATLRDTLLPKLLSGELRPSKS